MLVTTFEERAGKIELKQGKTRLEVVYPRATGEKERMLVAADCFALVQGQFVPEGPFKPGETYDDNLTQAAAAQVFEGVECLLDVRHPDLVVKCHHLVRLTPIDRERDDGEAVVAESGKVGAECVGGVGEVDGQVLGRILVGEGDRVVDGAIGAELLNTFKRFIEDPVRMLV